MVRVVSGVLMRFLLVSGVPIDVGPTHQPGVNNIAFRQIRVSIIVYVLKHNKHSRDISPCCIRHNSLSL